MNIESLLNKMSLKEKVGQLNQRLYGWETYEKENGVISLSEKFKEEVARWDGVGVIYGVFRADPWSGKNLTTGLSKEEASVVSQMIQDYVKENTTLGVPVLLSEECPHGHQGLDSLTTPANITSGASWNPELYEQVQEIVASEIREKGAHLGLISTLDVARDPRWGRTEECFSEDPYLTKQFTLAALRGLQGSNELEKIPSNRVLAVLKHFAGQGSAMGGHNAGPVNIGNRELREIHLPSMRAAVKNGAELCMAAYNDIDGVPCHGNYELLTEILRDEFGFKGAVMADGCALDRLYEVTGDRVKTAAWAIESGVDISLWDEVYPYLEEAVETGVLKEEILDQAVLRVLRLKDKLGLFEEQDLQGSTFNEEYKRELSVKLVEESIVLLKNDNQTLPLSPEKINKLAVVGPNSDLIYNQLGDYTPFKKEKDCVSVLSGIKTTFNLTGTEIKHSQGTTITSEIEGGIKESIGISTDADHIIVVLGGSSARDFSTTFDANGAAITGSAEMTSGENIDLADLRLPTCQIKLVKELAKLDKKMTAIIIEGRPHCLEEVADYFESILIAGYPGQYGGEGIANILTGKSNPSGKLAMTIPKNTGQLPVYYNYRDVSFKKEYFDSQGKGAYLFGSGLSYTQFEINDISVSSKDKNHNRKVTGYIKNIGSSDGAEVIQLYTRLHQEKVIPRVKELKGFQKVFLKSGEEKQFEILLADEELYYYNEKMEETHVDKLNIIIEATGFEQTIKMNQ